MELLYLRMTYIPTYSRLLSYRDYMGSVLQTNIFQR
jgi:hypothetical protein